MPYSEVYLFSTRFSQLFFWLTLFAGLVAFFFQGSRGLYEPTEGRYAEVGRETIESGDFDEPLLHGLPHFTKPPLTYMAIMLGIEIFGRNEWGVRFYGALSMVVSALGILCIGTMLWGCEIGFLGGMIFTSSPYSVIGANIASCDSLLTSWVVLAYTFYIWAIRNPEHRYVRASIICFWVSLGLAFLTKSTAAFVFVGPLSLWHLWNKPAAKLFSPVGIVLFCIIAFGWYLTEVEEPEHRGILPQILHEQLLGRLTSDEYHRNSSWFGGFLV